MVDMAEDDSILTFKSHKDAVFCCDLNYYGNLAFSGSQDHRGIIWDPYTGEIKRELTVHKGPIIEGGFNSASTLVATADIGGSAHVWHLDTGERICTCGRVDISWMQWYHNTDIVLAGTHAGSCIYLDSPTIISTNCDPATVVTSTCGSLLTDGEYFIAGYENGAVKKWFIRDMECSCSTLDLHDLPVTSVQCHPGSGIPFVLTGSEDGISKLAHTDDLKMLQSIQSCSGTHSPCIVKVGFSKAPLIATGGSCGLLTIYDCSASCVVGTVALEEPISKLICHEYEPFVFVATSRGKLYLFDMRYGYIVRRWLGHKSGILDFKISSTHVYSLLL